METSAALRALGALSQETRLRIFRLLVERGPEGLPAGEIGRKLVLPPATLSFHVKELASAGLVTPRQQGRSIRYSTDFGAMRRLLAYLSENCCGAGSNDFPIACTSDGPPEGAIGAAAFAAPKPSIRPKRSVT
jgi:DNA-binding transcriptional ArsR family regulator